MVRPDIEGIARRCEAATPGPWVFDDGLVWTPARGGKYEHDGKNDVGHGVNGEFVANARTDLPALLEYVRELEAENEELKKSLVEGIRLLMNGPDR